MASINEIVEKYFETGDQFCENRIIEITASRNDSTICKAEFFEVVSEVRKRLTSTNCQEIARAFLLLQSIFPQAGEDTLDFQLWICENKLFEDYYVHTNLISCPWCDIVNRVSEYLKKELRKSLECVICKKMPISAIKLVCQHTICKSCWMQAKVDLKKKCKSVMCPVDEKHSPKEYILGFNQEDFVSYNFDRMSKIGQIAKKEPAVASYSQAAKEFSTFRKMDCPNCNKTLVVSERQEDCQFCDKCEFCFCFFCRKGFHGITPCELKKDSKVEVKSEKQRPKSPTSFGPEANDFETNFYSKPLQDAFTLDEVQDAFHNDVFPEETQWPWESQITSNLITCPFKYESLKPGNWVEDELLENCIKIFLTKDELYATHGFLESYVVKFGASKNTGEFERVLLEKKILQKELVFILLNTDIFGGHGGHWILGIMHLGRKRIVLIDSSLVISSTFYQKSFFVLLHILHVSHNLEKVRFDLQEWQLIVLLDGVQQQNSYDCGPLAVCNAFAVIHRKRLSRSPKSIMVREWLLHTLHVYDSQEKSVEQLEQNFCERKPFEIEKFNPKGLKIEFKFYKDL